MWYFRTPNGGQELYVGPNMRIGSRVMIRATTYTIRASEKLQSEFSSRVIRPPIRDNIWTYMSFRLSDQRWVLLNREAYRSRSSATVGWRNLLRRYPKMDPKFLALCKLG